MTRFICTLILVVSVALLINSCKKEQALGTGYAPIVGNWQLVQRHIPVNTTSSTYTTQTIPSLPLQEITFNSDGSMSSVGKETEYYRSSRYYKVDSTGSNKKIGFIISDAYSAFYNGLVVKRDTIILVPCQTQDCNILLVRGR